MAARCPQRFCPYRGNSFGRALSFSVLLDTASKGQMFDFPLVFQCFKSHFGPFSGSGNSLHRPFPYPCRAANSIGVGLQLSVSRPPKSFGATLGHLGGFLGVNMVQDSSTMASGWPKKASRWPKMTLRCLRDGLRRLQDGLVMLRHRPRGYFGPPWGLLVASSWPTWRHFGLSWGQSTLTSKNVHFPVVFLMILTSILGHLGVMLGPYWLIFRFSWSILGPFWAIFGLLGPVTDWQYPSHRGRDPSKAPLVPSGVILVPFRVL